MNSETALLSLILDRPERLDECQDLLPEDFSGAHRSVFVAMRKLADSGQVVDMASLAEAGIPIETVAALVDFFAPSAAFDQHKDAVLDAGVRRRLKVAAKEAYHAVDPAASGQEALDAAEAAIMAVRERSPAVLKNVDGLLDTVWSEIENRMVHRQRLTGISSGWPLVDAYTFGWQKRKLYYIGGRPAMGKTSFVLQTAAYAARVLKVPTLMVSLEMGEEEIMQRIICQDARVSNEALARGIVTDEETARVSAALLAYKGSPFVIVDTPALSVGQIRGYARQVKRSFGGLGLVAVDYLGYLAGDGSRISVEANSKALKALSKELDVPVVCAAQLSRGVESREDKRPVLSDLRDTGAIEQDADIAAFLYRDGYYDPEAEQNVAELLIRKNRAGRCGTVRLFWEGSSTYFGNLEMNR